mgnify:CR=1 FL=1
MLSIDSEVELDAGFQDRMFLQHNFMSSCGRINSVVLNKSLMLPLRKPLANEV